MKNSQAKEILTKYSNGTCTDEERALAEAWYGSWNEQSDGELSEEQLDAAFTRLSHRLPHLQKPKVHAIWPKVGIAAAIATLIFGAYLLSNYRGNSLPASPPVVLADIAPGKNSATLTLASGRQIVLSDAGNGEFAQESGISITKSADGSIVYEVKEQNDAHIDADAVNIFTTAKGETNSVTLPDKSKVWLNAASSITFNTNIGRGGDRAVKLSGEAYFEVSHDSAHPFKVRTDKQEVTVLGTHFNIKAYPEEDEVKTTLLQGSVKVNDKTLRPGQQAVLTNDNMVIKAIDVDAEVSWKNGEFVFDGQDFKSIIGNISRWYNVEIEYDPVFADLHLGGQVSRARSLKGILKILERTGDVKFKVEGRRISVIK